MRLAGAQGARQSHAILAVRGANRLADADLSKPVLLSAAELSDDLERKPRPRLVSLQRADVAELTVSGFDLSECRFAGAHHLDKLRIEGARAFGRAPGRGSRRVLAEERDWRRHVAHNRRWEKSPGRRYPTDWLGKPDELGPAEVAGLYRALRKGREDAKDEPGAADFYYGEMQMRRLSKKTTPRAERFILWFYWLLSGYGLRAWRALFAFTFVAVAFSALFWALGFVDKTNPYPPTVTPPTTTTPTPPAPSPTILPAAPTTTPSTSPAGLTFFRQAGDAVTFSVGTATSVISGPEARLSRWGRFFRVVLRVLGPVLLGLAILSLRGRVKR